MMIQSRRQLLQLAANGFGAAALSALLADEACATAIPVAHVQPRVKNVIFLFMEGAVSQVDSFDYKPDLAKFNGQDPHKVIGELAKTQFANIGKVLKSPWSFKKRGKSGQWASNLFPHIAGHDGHPGIMDDVCVLRSMTSNFPEHASANFFLHSGHGLQGRPSMGAWVTYGLGSINQNLPGFVVLNGGQIPGGGLDNFSNGFLPASFQGSLLNAIGSPLANVQPNEQKKGLQPIKRRLVSGLNGESLRNYQGPGKVDSLESAIRNYELAARMQTAIPELMDIRNESKETQQLYGVDSKNKHTATYARECLIARRLVERGVRFIELTIPMTNGYQRWDAHNDLRGNHELNARAVDQPIAGLIMDLKRRGMLDQTLVIWGSEFGRTPFAQGANGRDHNEFGFTMWLAGGGVKPGLTYGATDRWGYKTIENRLEIHDLHATMLHLMGLDHTKLTYRFGGRDIRLTDVRGRVIHEILV